MDREFSDEITGLMPMVPHKIAGVDCPGRVVAIVDGNHVELRCDRCGGVVGVVQVGVMEGLLGLDCGGAECPHCHKLNTLPEADAVTEFVCEYCGKSVRL
jgi:hypothetical protein